MKLQPYTIPQSTFLLRTSLITLQYNLFSASSSNHSSLVSSPFTSNDCSHQSSHHLSHNTSNHIKTNYQRLSNYTPSSISSDRITHDDDASLPTTNTATPLGIQKAISLDRQKKKNIIPSKHGYQYDSPFHSSNSDRYVSSESSPHNIHSKVPTILFTSIQIQPPPITEISITYIPTQHFLDSPLYTPLHSDHRPQQRLFHPMKHQQGA